MELANESCADSLDFRCPLKILLYSVLGNCRTPHGLLELRKGIIQMLSGWGRSNLRQAEENHMADDLDLVRIVREARNDSDNELVKVEFRQTSIKLRKR